MLDTDKSADYAELSERELEILRLVATGASNKEIAHQLYISTNTVKVHLRNIFSKVGAASRTEAALYAVRMRIVDGMDHLIIEDEGNIELPVESIEQGSISGDGVTVLPRRIYWGLGVITFLLLALLIIAVRSPTTINLANTHETSPGNSVSIQESRLQTLADTPTSRTNFAIAVYENDIYAIAGESSEGVVGTVERYSIENDTWDLVASKRIPVTEVKAAVIGGFLYVPGGKLATGSIANTLEVYDPRQDKWETRSSLPVPLSAYSLVAYEGRLYIFGGWDGEQYVNTVFEYDPNQDSWKEKTPMPTARSFAGAVAIAGKVLVLGGYNGKQALKVNEVYLPDRDGTGDNPWETGSPMPDGRYGFGVANVADLIHVVGGRGNGQNGGRILAYHPLTDRWEAIEGSMATNWGHFGFVTWGPYWYIMGGEMDDALTNRNLSYQAVYTISLPIVR
jgi:DNA-binding CsgD family transcriptional regulator